MILIVCNYITEFLISMNLSRMKSLLKPSPDRQYVDLTLSFENEQREDVPGPPVHYYF